MNWFTLGSLILRFRVGILAFLLSATAFMAWQSMSLKLSYDSNLAIPLTNQKAIDFAAFRKQFGGDNNIVVLGVQTGNLRSLNGYRSWDSLQQKIKNVGGVEAILALPQAVYLKQDNAGEKLIPISIFARTATQLQLDSAWQQFDAQPFYRYLLYNPETSAHLMALTLNRDSANSKSRTALMNAIQQRIDEYEASAREQVYISGLPYIRTRLADKLAFEMRGFLIGSLLLTALTMLIFFRSISATLISLAVVGMSVVWSTGTMVMLGYKITLLTALIPPLIVVIGIPNCIYFLNKYHSAWMDTGDKSLALRTMVGRMGVVTLFCNVAAAIGFVVFAFTQSILLKEFGIVSGVNIMLLFFLSLLFIPAVLSYLPPPKPRHLRYLNSQWLHGTVHWLKYMCFQNGRQVVAASVLVTLLALAGMWYLERKSFIVDDLPKTDPVYTSLHWFETHFGGVMPLEIVVDTKKKNGLLRQLQTLENIDSLSRYLEAMPEMGRPLSLVEGLKFARQGYYDNDIESYATPTEFDIPLMARYLRADAEKNNRENALSRMSKGFVDSLRQRARITVNMKDIGSEALPVLLARIQLHADSLFGKNTKVTLTGGSVTFVEGSRFIVGGLTESIFYAFLLIALCMWYLFRSGRILLCSLIPNVIPLLITAGVMGASGVALKPSTVLVFSIALGISIDVTIRFLVSYRQMQRSDPQTGSEELLKQTLESTAVSILYTSIVLVAGFVIFCFSEFGGTRGLGWLTSLTLVLATCTNLLLLPVLLRHLVFRAALKK